MEGTVTTMQTELTTYNQAVDMGRTAMETWQTEENKRLDDAR